MPTCCAASRRPHDQRDRRSVLRGLDAFPAPGARLPIRRARAVTQRVTIIGAGTIGPSLALTFAIHGFPTTLIGRRPDVFTRAQAEADRGFAELEQAGLLPEADTGWRDRLGFECNLAAGVLRRRPDSTRSLAAESPFENGATNTRQEGRPTRARLNAPDTDNGSALSADHFPASGSLSIAFISA